MEKIKRKYIKWILKLDRRTPNYILEEETKEGTENGGHKKSNKI